jgi:hypothetical protein
MAPSLVPKTCPRRLGFDFFGRRWLTLGAMGATNALTAEDLRVGVDARFASVARGARGNEERVARYGPRQ